MRNLLFLFILYIVVDVVVVAAFAFYFLQIMRMLFLSLICVSECNLLFIFVYLLSDFDSGSQSNLMCEFFFSDYSIFSMYIEFSLNFLLFLLSQIVKLKTKKIKPFCFARAKYFRFVDVAFCFPVCVSLLFFVVCVCVFV